MCAEVPIKPEMTFDVLHNSPKTLEGRVYVSDYLKPSKRRNLLAFSRCSYCLWGVDKPKYDVSRSFVDMCVKNMFKSLSKDLQMIYFYNQAGPALTRMLQEMIPKPNTRFVFHVIDSIERGEMKDDGVHINTLGSSVPVINFIDVAKRGQDIVCIFDGDRSGRLMKAFLDNSKDDDGNPLLEGRIIAFFSCTGKQRMPISMRLPFDALSSAIINPILFVANQFPFDFNSISKEAQIRLRNLLRSVVFAIAGATLDKKQYDRLMEADRVIASMFFGFIVASRFLCPLGALPLSIPSIPDTSTHVFWNIFDVSFMDMMDSNRGKHFFLRLKREFDSKMQRKLPIQEFMLELSMLFNEFCPDDVIDRHVLLVEELLDQSNENMAFALRTSVLNHLFSAADVYPKCERVWSCLIKLLSADPRISVLVDKEWTSKILGVAMPRSDNIDCLAFLCLWRIHRNDGVDKSMEAAANADDPVKVLMIHYNGLIASHPNRKLLTLELLNYTAETYDQKLAVLAVISLSGCLQDADRVHEKLLTVLHEFDTDDYIQAVLYCSSRYALFERQGIGEFVNKCRRSESEHVRSFVESLDALEHPCPVNHDILLRQIAGYCK